LNNDAIGIGCDWGTTTLRAYLLGRDAQILEKIEVPERYYVSGGWRFSKKYLRTL